MGRRVGEGKRSACRMLMGKAEQKRPVGRPRHRAWIILKLILDRMRSYGLD
jgi:hypothetical protein